jgi:hypothetical protein
MSRDSLQVKDTQNPALHPPYVPTRTNREQPSRELPLQQQQTAPRLPRAEPTRNHHTNKTEGHISDADTQ